MPRLRFRRGLRAERGQSTVEFALALPLVIVALLLVVQIGLVVRDSLVVHNLAREVARAAAVDPTAGAVRQAANKANKSLDPQRVTVELDGGSAQGELVIATVVYQAPTSVPIVGLLIGDVPLSAQVTMRVE